MSVTEHVNLRHRVNRVGDDAGRQVPGALNVVSHRLNTSRGMLSGDGARLARAQKPATSRPSGTSYPGNMPD